MGTVAAKVSNLFDSITAKNSTEEAIINQEKSANLIESSDRRKKQNENI